MARLDLVLPGLVLIPGMARELSRCHAPALQTLLARGHGTRAPADGGLEGWLCAAFGVGKQQDWPVAPLTLAADGGEPGPDYWLRADPVHLSARREQLVLADSGTFALTVAEAADLTDALNRHFREDGLHFLAATPGRWYLRPGRPLDLRTRPVSEAAGRHVDPFLPAGGDALAWHRTFNEVQMLLFGHPVNTAREARGELAVNSVWVWGGGTYPINARAFYQAVYADDALARALARVAEVAAEPVPAHAAAALRGDAGRALAVVSDLDGPAQYGDLLAWQEALTRLEGDWFAPLLGALKAGNLAELRLIGLGSGVLHSFRLRRADVFKLWRRPALLAAALGARPESTPGR